MPPTSPVCSDEHASLFPRLLRSRLAADLGGSDEIGVHEPIRPSGADLVVCDLLVGAVETANPEPRQAISDVESVPGLLDEGLEIGEIPQ